MQKIIKPPAGELAEGEFEILECGRSDPETSAVVPEEVLGQRDVFRNRFDAAESLLLYM